VNRAATLVSAFLLGVVHCTSPRGDRALSEGALSERGLGPGAGQGLAIEMRLLPIRSLVHLSYRSSGIGEVLVKNGGRAPMEGLLLCFDLPDRPDLLPEPVTVPLPPVEAGGVASARVRPRFGPAILNEPSTEVVARAEVLQGGRVAASSRTLVAIIERSVVTWDLPERVAALVDPEPVARLVRGSLPAPSRAVLASRNLELAAEAYDALRSWGLRYLEDSPPSRAAALLGEPADRVNPPGETLRDHGGDCDDLTVLLASALEAVGVPSAVAVAEDHVFALFDAGLPASRLEAAGLEPERVLERGARVWIPLEATCLARSSGNLLAAWECARPRLPGLRSGQTRLFEVREAWSSYPSMPEGPPPASGEAAHRTGRSAALPSPSARALRQLFRLRVEERARSEEAKAGEEAGLGARRAAAVFAEAGYRSDARRLLEETLARFPDPTARLELAAVILSDPEGPQDLAAARRELERALAELDPLDLAARTEAETRLQLLDRLQGTRREPAPVLAAATPPLPALESLLGGL
jgi:hypothetical protein